MDREADGSEREWGEDHAAAGAAGGCMEGWGAGCKGAGGGGALWRSDGGGEDLEGQARSRLMNMFTKANAVLVLY